MSERKTFIRFFTIADYEEEEIWLHDMHMDGWRLLKMVPPCFFLFEACEPEDVTYRLDYKNNRESGDYYQLFRDYGWEYVGQCVGWLYFRKPASQAEAEQDGELFSDNASRVELIRHVIRTRLLPLCILFFCVVIPNWVLCLSSGRLAGKVWTGFWAGMLMLYSYLIVHCGLKLKRLKKKYQQE